MNKVPPFIGYTFHPEYIIKFYDETTKHRASITALGKDGTIWRTFHMNNDEWAPWKKIG
jgi:hypothetical protein